jgi:hypothetical protein
MFERLRPAGDYWANSGSYKADIAGGSPQQLAKSLKESTPSAENKSAPAPPAPAATQEKQTVQGLEGAPAAKADSTVISSPDTKPAAVESAEVLQRPQVDAADKANGESVPVPATDTQPTAMALTDSAKGAAERPATPLQDTEAGEALRATRSPTPPQTQKPTSAGSSRRGKYNSGVCMPMSLLLVFVYYALTSITQVCACRCFLCLCSYMRLNKYTSGECVSMYPCRYTHVHIFIPWCLFCGSMHTSLTLLHAHYSHMVLCTLISHELVRCAHLSVF